MPQQIKRNRIVLKKNYFRTNQARVSLKRRKFFEIQSHLVQSNQKHEHFLIVFKLHSLKMFINQVQSEK